ncbi:MAG: hypothetical protein HQL40_04815, partial [Alphaproteobacteria bacterium]|nr:hypothetical protein [Alphaproteobacteria bacterium]
MFWFKRRPNPLFERTTAVESLGRAWRRVKANGGGPGGDGMPLEVFSRHLDERLAGLSRHLSEGSYRPAPLREAVISKKDGTDRKLRVPSIVDRVAQAAVATVLSEQLDGTMSEGSFGYRPGRSVAQAIERVRAARRAGCGWVVDGDIRRFLDHSSDCPPVSGKVAKRSGSGCGSLIRKPFRRPWRMWTAVSSPRLTRCNTAWRDRRRVLVASIIG